MADIKIQTLTKTYPGAAVPAVDNITLNISKGEIITFLGPSGCGKTTALRLIAGFESPDRGDVFFDGRKITGVLPEKRHVGMVFQDYALFPHLNVRENIGFGLDSSRERGRRIEEMLNLVGLEGHGDKMPDMLSGGQQGRVALARALVRRPAVVLLDEPFGSLDADLRSRMQQDVTSIVKKAGATAVFVTHDQKEAMTISDRIAVMRDGRLEQVGAAREIYQHPETRFVAGFVGDSNILTGVMGKDGRSVKTSIGDVPCRHTHGHGHGDAVTICIRPCAFERDESGPVRGRIIKTTFTGDNTDAVLEVPLRDGRDAKFKVHLHPEDSIEEGEKASFRIIPYFVAVVSDPGKKGP